MALHLEWKRIWEFGFHLLVFVFSLSVVSGEEGDDGDLVQKFTVKPESVEVNAGDNAFLKCVVQNQQGKTQWTKDGFALGFERDVPGYPRYSYSGDSSKGEHHLVITGATLEDDGEYQCQVGPTSTTAALWAAANVTVMVSPSSISVLGSGGDDGKVEAVMGQNLHLQCVVRDARPAPSVAWYKNGIMLDQDLHTEKVEESSKPRQWSVRSKLVLVPEAVDDGQQYSCRALHPSLMSSPTSLVASVVLSVLHPPGPPVIKGYSTGHLLREGDEVTLSCESFGGNPSPDLQWYKNGHPLRQLNSSKMRTSGDENEEEGVGVRLKIIVKPDDDRAVYECKVTSPSLSQPLVDNVTFTVHYSPALVVVNGPSVAAAGQEFILTCVTSKANPSASINWFVHGVQVTTVSSLVSEADDGGWVTSSDLKYHLERSLRLAKVPVECRAHNSASDKVVRETRLISIIKPPGRPVLEVEGVGDVVAGGRLVITCATKGGNPHPGVTIYKGREKLITEIVTDGRVTRARAITEVMAADNGAKVACEVTNEAMEKPLVAHTKIELLFPPWEVNAWVSPRNVAAGQVAKLICESSSSLPTSTITWRSGVLVLHGGTPSYNHGLYGGNVTRSELEVRALIEDNNRLFTCDANNGLGVSVTNNVTLNVLHEPVWIDVPTGTEEVHEKEDLVLTALAKANPPPITYTWWRGPLMIEDGKTEEGKAEGRLKIQRIHRQESGSYSVTASSPRGTVNASFTINVLYGPESMMASERVTVEEDGSTTILCSAIGNPAPNITWFRQDDNTSTRQVLSWGISEARLVIDKVTREETGFYWCLASNVVDSPAPISTAVVVTQAPEPPADDSVKDEYINKPWADVGGTGRLECTVRAAPAPNFRWTISEDRVLFNSRKYFIRRPQLIDGLVKWSSILEIRSVTSKDYTSYTCTTTNSRGTYTSNHTLGPSVSPSIPQGLNVTNVIGSTAILSWTRPKHGTAPDGYNLKYRPPNGEKYAYLEVVGREVSTVKVQGLSPGTVYEFVIQSYNAQGRSDFTSPPTIVSVPGVIEEVASSSSQPRVPRLTLLLMSLTGAALLVLNISIIVCFVRRFAMNRGTSVSYKTTASEGHTPASTPALTTDEDERTLSSDTVSAPIQYQVTRQPSLRKADAGKSGLRIHHLTTEVIDSPTRKGSPLPIPTPDHYSALNSPTLKSKRALLNGGLCNTPPLTSMSDSISSDKHGDKYTDWGSDTTSRHLDDNISRRMKVPVHPSDIPDVCPKSPGSSSPLIRHQSQETTHSEDDRTSLTSHQSSTSYVNIHDQVHGIGRHTPLGLHRQESMSPPLVMMHSTPSKMPSASPSCQDNSARSSISDKSQAQEALSSSSSRSSGKPASQVIYHGQPHIQHQHEKQQQQQQFQDRLQQLEEEEQDLEEEECHHDHHHQRLEHHRINPDRQGHHPEFHQRQHQYQHQHQHQHQQHPSTARASYHAAESRGDFYQPVPCCHQPRPPPLPQQHRMQRPEYHTHFEHQHQQHQHQQHSPSHHIRFPDPRHQHHYHHHHHHHESVAAYPHQDAHDHLIKDPGYFLPSDYHLSMPHSASHHLLSLEDSDSAHSLQLGGSENHSALYSPVAQYNPREYQYPIPFTEQDYRGYMQQHSVEQHQLQCIREEVSSDISQYSGLDPSALFSMENNYDDGCGHQESPLEK